MAEVAPRPATPERTPRRRLPAACRLLLAACCLLLPRLAVAGGGPENLLLVVNPNSPASMCIANHYVRLRHIPTGNIVYLPWDPAATVTDVETFRQKILSQILDAARMPRTGRRIDYIIYSSDFPWAVQLHSDIDKFKKTLGGHAHPDDDPPGGQSPHGWPMYLTPLGSINGLTYLWDPVSGGFAGYFDRHSNWYVRSGADEPTVAFSSSTRFGPEGEVVGPTAPGRHYVLSMMLGVTSGRGNTVAEVLEYLRRGAAADGTRPRGTIYFVENSDVRSTARQAGFAMAVRQLKALGVGAEIVEGIMPMNKKDVLGAMLGTASFDWKASGSTILGGAICEHFTSFGGDLGANAGQTPLSEFLRNGAVAASGTVTEPYAIADKFPAARMQVHYARGCTAAEAFYQSVSCPYQLLIVGDPLCRPWANLPEVSVAGVESGAVVRGMLRLKPSARFREPGTAEHFELYVDGLAVRSCPADGELNIDTTAWSDGYHELRVLAIERGPIRTEGERILTITTANHRRLIWAAVSAKTAAGKEPLVVTAKAPGCANIIVFQGTRVVGKIAGEEGRAEISPATLGTGPVQLFVVGLGLDGPKDNVFAEPLDLTIEEPAKP